MSGSKTDLNAELAPLLTDPEVVNLAPFPFAITDIETGEFVYMNEMVRNLFGIRRDTKDKLNISSLYTDLNIRAQLVERILTNGRLTDLEIPLRRSDGSILWVLGAAQLVHFRGRLCGLIAVVDITKNKQLTDDLEKTQTELTQMLDITAKLQEAAERDSRAKSTLLVNLSHEIKTPLNGIIGISQVLVDEDISPELRTYIEAIQQAATSLHAVTNEILEHTELDSEEPSSLRILSDPAEIISKAIGNIGPQIRGKQLEVSTIISREVPHQVEINRDRLQQALTHLLNNAIKFTENGTISIACDFSLDHLSVTVSDTGVGIPIDRIGDIFHEFLQVDNGSTRRYGGIGLGLSIARKAIECIGGEIHVDSAEGQGSTFTIVVPVSGASQSRSQSPNDGRNVTIFSNSPEMRRMFGEVLSHNGYAHESSCLDDWDGAISLTDDLILLDLPNDDEVCSKVIAKLSSIPEMMRKHLVCLSHKYTFPDAQTITSLAPVRFISKPTDPFSLCAALRCQDIWNSPIVEDCNNDSIDREDCFLEQNTSLLPLVESIERDWGEVDDLFVRRIATLLGESCERCIEGIALGIDREDPVLVYAYAYQLYGSTLNAGAISTSLLCRKVLEAARIRNFASVISLLPMIRVDLTRFQEAIDWQLTRKEA